jgi:adenylate cyclase
MDATNLSVLAACLVAVLLGAACWHQRAEARRLRERLEVAARALQDLQRSFSRFAPDEVIEQIIASGMPTSGEKREVTALFADLVGFTQLSERLPPTVLVDVLNGYFERMSQAIGNHRGHVSTLLGDGLLALFGALEPSPWQSDDAVHAALAMRRELEDYNEELESRGLPRLTLGIGIHRSEGVAGLVGSRDLKEFTLVGGTVNVAARVQDLTRSHDAAILVTEDVQRHLDPRFALRPLPAAQLRGIALPVRIFAAEGFRDS